MGPVPYFAAAYIVALLSATAAWVTHIVVCIKAASYLFLIAGAVLPPIGVIHGYGVWFGWW
jgi:hypothetical protein